MATMAAKNSPRGSAVLASRYRPRRTDALPKHTLFGSNIEKVTNTDSIDDLLARLERPKDVNRRRYEPMCPDELKEQILGRESVKAVKDAYEQQKNKTNNSRKDLKSAELKALCFDPPSSREKCLKTPPKTSPSWFAKEDLENSCDINILGLNSRESYNHDKYGKKVKKPPGHNYELMGDVLNSCKNVPTPNSVYEALKKDDAELSDRNNCNDNHKATHNDTKTCTCCNPIFLCDNKKCFTCKRPRMDPSVITMNLKKEYEDLSNVLRSNVCAGYSIYHRKSLYNDSHNDDVYLKRDAPTDQFRARKDKYSAWREMKSLETNMAKVWAEIDKEKRIQKVLAKPTPTVKPAVPKVEKKPEPKAKDLTKKVPKKSALPTIPTAEDGNNSNGHNTPKKDKEDDDFWNFYDNPKPI